MGLQKGWGGGIGKAQLKIFNPQGSRGGLKRVRAKKGDGAGTKSESEGTRGKKKILSKKGQTIFWRLNGVRSIYFKSAFIIEWHSIIYIYCLTNI